MNNKPHYSLKKIAEAKELYQFGKYGYQRLSRELKIPVGVLRYHIDPQYRKEQNRRTNDWINSHKEQWQTICRKSAHKYYYSKK